MTDISRNLSPHEKEHEKRRKRQKITIIWKYLKRSRMLRVFSIVFILNFILGVFYSYLEDIPFYEGLYWATDTLTNTGSGLAQLNKEISWIITIIFMWIGLGITLLFVEYIYMRLFKSMREQRMIKFEEHIILIGWNPKIRHFLGNLPGELGGDHNYVLIADIASRPFDLPKMVEIIRGNPEEERILLKAGIKKAQQAIIVVEDDSSALLITMAIQAINDNVRIAVNLQSDESVKHMKRLGVEQIICDEELTGNELIKAFYKNQEDFFL